MSQGIPNGTDEKAMSFTFTGKALEDLQEIAGREGKELDEVIESALGLKKWALDVKENGGQVIVRRKKAEDRELVL